MTDRQYAILIYHNVLGWSADPEDANVRGIEAVLNELPDRERIALESRLRHEKTLPCVGQDIGVCKVTAGKLVDKALRKLRHTSRSKRMRISLIEEERDHYRQMWSEANETILDLKTQASLLAYRMPVNEDCKLAFAKFEISIIEIDFPPQVKNALIRAGKSSVESILAIPTFEKMMGIPRIGPKVAVHVIETMRDLGFREWSENMMAEAIQYDAKLAPLVAGS